jgi:hypothetical protein
MDLVGVVRASLEEHRRGAQLRDTVLRTDGDARPPNFVSGDAAPELAALIREVIASLIR